jgi:hypothetical protein
VGAGADRSRERVVGDGLSGLCWVREIERARRRSRIRISGRWAVLLVSRDSERERESGFPIGGSWCRPCSFPTVWRNTPETTKSKLLSSKGNLLPSPLLEIWLAGFERERARLQRRRSRSFDRESVVDGRLCRISGRREQGRRIPVGRGGHDVLIAFFFC